jgi:hypothetical protein
MISLKSNCGSDRNLLYISAVHSAVLRNDTRTRQRAGVFVSIISHSY